MGHGQQGLRALSVSLLALLGLMAFMVAGAQAETGAEWKILGVKITGKKAVTAELHTTSASLLIGGTFNITITCTKAESEGIEIFGEGESTGKVAFSGCTTVGGANCDPINQPIVASLKALLFLHNSETYILISPPTGSTILATIKFPNICSLAPSKNVTGTLVAECGHLSGGTFVHLNCNKEEASHLLQQAPAALFPSDALQLGAKPVSLDGIMKIFLTAEPTEKWGGLG